MRGKVAKFLRRMAKESGYDYKKLKKTFKKVAKK